uniref:Uncharacterized protein n=1 Tax=Caenorhabditis japonica TaxID=281687 RepID=A0A8R1ETF9_CAEJA
MRGAWGGPGEGVFMTKDKPDGFFLFVGVQRKIPENYSAMLVSNPIACQEGDGKIRFRHWTSPGVKLMALTSTHLAYKEELQQLTIFPTTQLIFFNAA